MKKAEFDKEGDLLNLRTELLNKCRSRRSRAARREKIVDEENTAARFKSIDMDCNSGGAVFEIILFLVGLVRELAFFPNRDEARFEFNGCGGGENKPARINANDGVDSSRFDVLSEEIDAAGEEARVGQNRGDVFKLDARLWKVRDVTNGAFDFSGSGAALSHEFVRLMCIEITAQI